MPRSQDRTKKLLVPAPRVDCTNPDAPAPAPPAPPVVPPAPAPGAPVPKPPTPPPGVPCTTPALTPRKLPPALRAQYVHVGDGQIVAGDRQVKIVFERQPNGILEGQVQLAVANQLIEQRRIREVGLRHAVCRIRAKRIVRCRHVIAHGRVSLSGSGRGQCDQEPCHTSREKVGPPEARSFIASPPRKAADPDWPCRQPSSRRATGWCGSRRLHLLRSVSPERWSFLAD